MFIYVVCRVYGIGTEAIIDRRCELENMRRYIGILTSLLIESPPIICIIFFSCFSIGKQCEANRRLDGIGAGSRLYAVFNNGIAYQFIHGDIITQQTVKETHILHKPIL